MQLSITLFSPLTWLLECFILTYNEFWWLSGKESACQFGRYEFDPWVRKIPWRRKWQPSPVFLPEKSHGLRSLGGYSPWGCKRVGHDLATKQQQQIMNFNFLYSMCSDHKSSNFCCDEIKFLFPDRIRKN